MKKSFATLIKLQKTFVDEQRQHLARLYDNLERIAHEIADLHAAMERERKVVKEDEAMRMTYGAFVKWSIDRDRELEKERKAAELAIKIAQDKLAELFEEQKRYEIAEEQRLEEEAKEERRLERIELDEIGGTRHERQKKSA